MRGALLYLLLVGFALPCCASRILKDELGRSITVPDHPHRLVCLIPNVVDDVYELGAGADVIAVSEFTKYPSEATSKPSVGVPLTPSIEAILSFHPDLVLASADSNRLATVRRLEELRIPVFVVNPHGIEGILSSLISLGKVLNREGAAAELVSRLRARLQAVRTRVENKPAIRVFMPIWYDPVITIGKRAFITEIIAAAGGRSITDDLPQEWPQVNFEVVMQRAPEALLLVRGSRMSLSDVSKRPGWSSLAAVRDQRVYFADDRIELPSPVAFDALEELANQLHP